MKSVVVSVVVLVICIALLISMWTGDPLGLNKITFPNEWGYVMIVAVFCGIYLLSKE